MSKNQESARDHLERLSDALARSILAADNNDLGELMGGEAGMEAAARDVDAVVSRAVKAHRKARLEAAHAERQRNLASLAASRPMVPSSPEERRKLFFAQLSAQPELTAAYRELDTFTDDDILDALLQMSQLGLLGSDD